MKRKASNALTTTGDPRGFVWNVFHRDHFVEVGERVWVKAEEQYGTVIGILPADEDEVPTAAAEDKKSDDLQQDTINSNPQAYANLGSQVQLDDGATVDYHRPHDAVRMYKTSSIVIAYSTDDFRLLAQTQDLGPSVLEIGCSTGQTSRILWKRCDRWMGWDTGKAMVDQLQQEIDDESTKKFVCCKLDPIIDSEGAWDMVQRHFSGHELSIMIDIGGNRDATAVAKILKWALGLSNELRMIAIKSEEMHGFNDPLAWFLSMDDVDIKTFPSHPLKAPKRCCPQDDSLPICRYFNYHPNGCKKGVDCEFDHSHCHWCLKVGHTALSCPNMTRKV